MTGPPPGHGVGLLVAGISRERRMEQVEGECVYSTAQADSCAELNEEWLLRILTVPPGGPLGGREDKPRVGIRRFRRPAAAGAVLAAALAFGGAGHVYGTGSLRLRRCTRTSCSHGSLCRCRYRTLGCPVGSSLPTLRSFSRPSSGRLVRFEPTKAKPDANFSGCQDVVPCHGAAVIDRTRTVPLLLSLMYCPTLPDRQLQAHTHAE